MTSGFRSLLNTQDVLYNLGPLWFYSDYTENQVTERTQQSNRLFLSLSLTPAVQHCKA